MIPFLKNKQEPAISGPVDEIKTRKSDEDAEFDLINVIAEDIMESIDRRNVRGLKECLQALIDHIKYEDEIQDHEEFEK